MPETKRPQIWFVTGSDTDVGKTYIASLLARQLRHSGMRVGVYKPVASGCVEADGKLDSTDARELWQAAGRPLDLEAVCPQRFRAPLAPHRAAAAEGKHVDRERLKSGAEDWFPHCDELIIEGAGGLLSPLASGLLNADLALSLAPLRLVIVVANRLGGIHQALATIAAAERRGLQPAGIVLCEVVSAGTAIDHNADEITQYTDVPIMAQIAYGQTTRINLESCLNG